MSPAATLYESQSARHLEWQVNDRRIGLAELGILRICDNADDLPRARPGFAVRDTCVRRGCPAFIHSNGERILLAAIGLYKRLID